MLSNPSNLRTADALLAQPDCAHIITMNNPNQNLHLERLATGLRFTAGSPGNARHVSREFASLDSLYEHWDAMYRDVKRMVPDLRDAIWQDITYYPLFSGDVLYLPLDSTVELIVPQDSEQVTVHGPHVIYGPAEIATTATDTYRINATAGWLVVERPACTHRGGVRGMLRPTRNMLDRLRLKHENSRLRRQEAPPLVRPGVTVAYGKPPADWRALSQSLNADHPLPTV